MLAGSAGLNGAHARETGQPRTLHALVGAPEALKLSGSVRARYESLHGQARPGLDAAPDLFTLRTILFGEYDAEWRRIGVELYDCRAYLAEAGSGISTGEVNALELVQAFVGTDFRDVLGPGSNASLQAGRFTLNLGSRRLVAADDYRNTTNGYTGLRVDLKAAAGPSATLIYTLPQVRLPDDLPAILDNEVAFDRENSDLVLWGGIANFPQTLPAGALEVAYFDLRERDSAELATRNRQLHTGSVRFYRDPLPGRLDFDMEGAWQAGSIRSSTAALAPELGVSAYFYHLEAGYQATRDWKPRLSLEYDRVSGDEPGGDHNRFDTMFGMRRGEFAPSAIYAAVGRANISSPVLRIEVTPGPLVDGFLVYRALWLESRTDSFSTSGVRDASGNSGAFAGHQLDVRVRYWLIPQSLRFEVNALVIFKGDFLEDAPNAPATGDTKYLSLNLTASF